MQEKVQEFAARMSSISQIYFHVLNTERRLQNTLPLWRRIFSSNSSKKDIFMQALGRMSDLDISQLTADALGYSLPQFQQQLHQASHLKEKLDGFKPFHQSSSASAARTFTSSANVPLNAAGGSSVNAPDGDLQMTGMSFMSKNSPNAGSDAAGPAQSKAASGARATASSLGTARAKITKSRDRKCLTPSETAEKSAVSVFELQEVVVHSAATDVQSSGNQLPAAHRDKSASATSERFSSAAVGVVKTTSSIGALPQYRSSKSLIAAIRRPAPTAVVDVAAADDAVGCTIIPQPPPQSRSGFRPRETGGEAAAAVGTGGVDNRQLLAPAPSVMKGDGAGILHDVLQITSSRHRDLSSSLPASRRSEVVHAPAAELQNPLEDLSPPPGATTDSMDATAHTAHSRRSPNAAECAGVQLRHSGVQQRHRSSTDHLTLTTTAPLAIALVNSALPPTPRRFKVRSTVDAVAKSAGSSAPAESPAHDARSASAAILSLSADGRTQALPLPPEAEGRTAAARAGRSSQRPSKTNDRPSVSRKKTVNTTKAGPGTHFEEC
jgi:hypothetical protein